MTGDWITVHRKLLTNPVMQHDGLFRLWMFCLMKAAWKDGRWLVPGTTSVMDVKRGQFITGRESLHSALYGGEYSGEHRPSSRTLWRWLESLAAMECVKLETVSNRCTIVTVVKYNTYQKDKQQDVQQVSSTCPAGVQHMSTVEESNKSTQKESNKKTNTKGDPDKSDSPQVDVESVRFPVFPCVIGRRSKSPTWTLPQDLVEELQAVFAGVDVPGQCREAHMWCKTNKADRKTADGMPEFLRRWMKRQQNQRLFSYQGASNNRRQAAPDI